MEQIIEEDPKFYKAYNKLGVIEASRKNKQAALDYFQKGLDIKRDSPQLLVNAGSIYLEDNQYDTARRYYEEAIRVAPQYHMSYYHLAILCKKQGDYDSFHKYIKEYQKLERQNISTEYKKHKGSASKHSSNITAAIVVVLIVIVAIYMFSR